LISQAEVRNFPLTGISEDVISQKFLKFETSAFLISNTKKLLIHQEYERIENILYAAEANKWSKVDLGV